MAQTLSNLPIGAKVKFGKYAVNGSSRESIVWRVVAREHNTSGSLPYPNNSTTLITDKIIDIRCYDAKEPNSSNSNRASYGNSFYRVSNVDQWLNSAKYNNSWYTAQHSTDQAPNNASYISGTASPQVLYASRPGFLYWFTEYERNAIMDTNIASNYPTGDGTGIDYLTRKVFLPSTREMMGTSNAQYETGLDSQYQYFKTNGDYYGTLTQQCYDNTAIGGSGKPSSVDAYYGYWTRSVDKQSNYTVNMIRPAGTTATAPAAASKGDVGVMPVINLHSYEVYVSDTVDADGCYIVNNPPSMPGGLNAYTMAMYEGYPWLIGGDDIRINWNASSDNDNDAITYVVDAVYYYEGNPVTSGEVYRGTATECIHSLPTGFSHVEYSVKAVDAIGLESSVNSYKYNVKNFNAPTITMSSNLGEQVKPFTLSYTLYDIENEYMFRDIWVDGKLISSIDNMYDSIFNGTYTIDFTGETWLKLSNGSHTVKISVTDAGSEYPQTTTKTCVFTKNASAFTVQNTTPMEASTMPVRIVLRIAQVIPSGATSKIEVCNNAFDSSPKWEDATDSVVNSFAHVFENKSKTDYRWGVAVRVTIDRGDSEGACYISSIGGNFE